MSRDDLERVKDDLAAIRTAAGLDTAWGRRGLRSNLLFAVAGLAALAWAVAPHGLPPAAGLLALLVPVFDWLRTAWDQSGGPREVEQMRREWRQTSRLLWLAIPLTALHAWTRYLGMPPLQFVGIVAFLFGFVMFGPAVSERGYRPLLGWAVALMAGGLLFPLGVAPIVLVGTATISLGGLLSAGLVTLESSGGATSHGAG